MPSKSTLTPPGEVATSLQAVADQLSDLVTEQWLLAGLLEDGRESDPAEVAARMVTTCAALASVSRRLWVIADGVRQESA